MVSFRSSNVKHIMAKRMDYAKDKGCDAIDPDNVDGWQAHNGFSFTKADQVAYNSWLADRIYNLCVHLLTDEYTYSTEHY